MKTGDSFEKPGKERGVGVFGARTTGFGATDVVRVRGENDPINFSVLRMTERSLFIRLILDDKNCCTTGSGCVPTCLMWIGDCDNIPASWSFGHTVWPTGVPCGKNTGDRDCTRVGNWGFGGLAGRPAGEPRWEIIWSTMATLPLELLLSRMQGENKWIGRLRWIIKGSMGQERI